MSIIEVGEPTGYELRVNVLDYDDPFDDIDRKNSVIQFVYHKQVSWKQVQKMSDNCEFFTNKTKCNNRYNELVKKVKHITN